MNGRFEPRHGHSGFNGRAGTPTYHSWNNMKQRCTNPRHISYPLYGARGIRYDPRWERFDDFLSDMGECPPGMQLERNDNNGNYHRKNCRWATRRENMNNRRNTQFVEYRGRRVAVANLARECGFSYMALCMRLRAGWSVERAAETPLRVTCR